MIGRVSRFTVPLGSQGIRVDGTVCLCFSKAISPLAEGKSDFRESVVSGALVMDEVGKVAYQDTFCQIAGRELDSSPFGRVLTLGRALTERLIRRFCLVPGRFLSTRKPLRLSGAMKKL